ncbi:tetratricopeptide repeat protein [Candidatus Dependentiae bacterium]
MKHALFFAMLLVCSTGCQALQTADDFFNAAMACKQKGNADKAISFFQKALALNPRHFSTNFHLGCEYYYRGLYDNAITHYEKAIAANPNSARAHFNLGVILDKHKGREKEAYAHFTKAIACDANYAKAYFHCGKILEQLGNAEYAATNYRHAIQAQEDYIDAYAALAKILRDREECEEAIELLEKAVTLQPNNVHLLFDLGFCANMIGQSEKAITAYKKIVLLNSDHAQSFYNIGYTLKLRGDVDEAIEMYKLALKIRPDYADARYALALAYLNKSSFLEGWKEYEDYLKKSNLNSEKLRRWLKTDQLAGKRILLREQGGLGDTMQFIRYAQELKQRGAYTILIVRKPLVKILSGCNYIDKLIELGKGCPPFHEQATLMALPAIFNSTEETIPKNIPYLFPNESLTQQWKDILNSSEKRFKVGLCWTSNLHNDACRHPIARRSISLDLLAPLAQFEDVEFYSLQKENNQVENAQLNVTVFDKDFDDSHGSFMDTAALIKNLDLVITIDTAIAHLAGGLGIPVWLMLPFNVDWRWIVNRSDSPWYPAMRIFKQQEPMNWKPVVQNVVKALHELVQATE